MTSPATLRFLGHMGRNGGNLWALKAAERYFPEGHLLLKAYRSRCRADPTPLVEDHDQDLSAQKSKIHSPLLKANRTDPLKLFSRRNFTTRKEALGMMTLNRRPLSCASSVITKPQNLTNF